MNCKCNPPQPNIFDCGGNFCSKCKKRIMVEHKTRAQANEALENLQKEYETLEDTIADFLTELDRNNVEIPTYLHPLWNELHELIDN
jgi:hypothetical protein